MTAIVTSNFRVINAENFKEDVADAATSVYVGIGCMVFNHIRYN